MLALVDCWPTSATTGAAWSMKIRIEPAHAADKTLPVNPCNPCYCPRSHYSKPRRQMLALVDRWPTSATTGTASERCVDLPFAGMVACAVPCTGFCFQRLALNAVLNGQILPRPV